MTIIAALNLKNWFGRNLNKILIAGDSRLTRDSETSGKFVSRFDSAQKVVPLSENVIIGLAGDYRVIRLVEDLKHLLNQSDPSGKPKFQRFAKFLREEI